MALKEYKPGTAFTGVIGRTFDKSSPAWPEPLRAKKDAPNVIFIVQDDTGFGQLGCYGGPIRTPNLDALAANGLLFNSMHTTALCSPTRSCILTGRNHHSNAMSCITERSTGYPGSNGNIPFENGFLSEMLVEQGYSTFAIGKWHLTPADQISAAGPYNRWPLGRGFERYYGFLGGDTHQYYPELVYDNHAVEPEKTPEEGYHLTEDLVDKAIAFIADTKQVAPDKPFFLYLAPGAAHAPHHVPKEWADQYKGAVRRRLGRASREDVQAAEGARDRPEGCRAVASRPGRPGLEHAVRRGAEAVRPDDGGVRGLRDPHRPPLRPAVRLPEVDRRLARTRSSCSSPTTARAPRAGRPDR